MYFKLHEGKTNSNFKNMRWTAHKLLETEPFGPSCLNQTTIETVYVAPYLCSIIFSHIFSTFGGRISNYHVWKLIIKTE